MEQAGIEQQLHYLRDATGLMQVDGHIATTGFEIANHRDPLANGLKVIDVELNAGRAGNRQQVQHRIGGSTHRHNHRDCIFKSLTRQQIKRANVGFNCLDQYLGTAGSTLGLFGIFGGHCGAVGQAQAHGFDGRTHGIGCEHAATTSNPRTRILLNGDELGFINLAGGHLTHSLK